MLHVSAERLAALADGQPTHEEAAHLVACEDCAHERGAYRALIEMAELSYILSRPFAAPPGIPPARAKALQAAFLAVHKDPELLAEADRLKLGITPVGVDEVLPLIEKIANSPPDVMDYMRKLQGSAKGG